MKDTVMKKYSKQKALLKRFEEIFPKVYSNLHLNTVVLSITTSSNSALTCSEVIKMTGGLLA